MVLSKPVGSCAGRIFTSVGVVILALSAAPAVQAKTPEAQASSSESLVGIDTGARSGLADGVTGWVAALTAYRLKNYPQAMERFTAVAADGGQTDWVRAGANFWAARVATALGDDLRANGFLRRAAAFPNTFYGLIAERRLGSPYVVPRSISASQFPRPELAPEGGFTVSKALVYALVRQESRFNAAAIGGGAYGLMQLTPATATRISGDERFRRDPRRLHDAGVNLRLGQVYVAKLLASVQGDLLQAMAAYNCGPGVLKKFGMKLDGGTDALLMIESLPVASARNFVEHVMTNYWTYRRIFGLPSPTLDAAASGVGPVLASLDD